MYPEFIAIYVMLVIVIAMLGATLFFLMKLMKNGEAGGKGRTSAQQNNDAYYAQQYQQQYQQYQPQYQQYQQYQPQAGSVVFCKHCATQFDASQAYCPKCGTRR